MRLINNLQYLQRVSQEYNIGRLQICLGSKFNDVHFNANPRQIASIAFILDHNQSKFHLLLVNFIFV